MKEVMSKQTHYVLHILYLFHPDNQSREFGLSRPFSEEEMELKEFR